MIYKIHPQDVETLLSKPESGMGYQIVKAKQYNNLNMKKYVVYNSDLAIELNSDFQRNKGRIQNEGYKIALSKATEIMLETNSILILDQSEAKEIGKIIGSKNDYNRHSGGSGAINNPKENANGTEIFVRISAFENDKRVDVVNKKLKPGTFSTSYNDYSACITSNDDPIDRYALPNDDTIKWAFYVQPKTIDVLQRGIVQPAFGHKGGGIEAYFENGTSDNTFQFKREYGK